MPANENNQKDLEHRKRVLEARRKEVLAAAQSLASKIGDLSITLTKKVGENEKLFGSVTAHEIEEAIVAKGVEIPHKKIALQEPIRKVGVCSHSQGSLRGTALQMPPV